MEKDIKVLYVSSNIGSFIETGELMENKEHTNMNKYFPQYLQELGYEVRVVFPEYRQIPANYVNNSEQVAEYETQLGWRYKQVKIYKINVNEVQTYLVNNKSYFDRDSLYDNDDKHEQFAFFARAVLEMLPKVNFIPDIIHCHDWQTGLISLLLKDDYSLYDFYQNIKTVYTIHDLQVQGEFDPAILNDVLGISQLHWNLGGIKHNNLINYLKTGIMYSDKITTLSMTYANEVKTKEYGKGLDYVFRRRDKDFFGIIKDKSYSDFKLESDDCIWKQVTLKYVELYQELVKGKI